jgi:hypothetical protein
MTLILVIIAVLIGILPFIGKSSETKRKVVLPNFYKSFNEKGINLLKDLELKVLNGIQFEFRKEYLQQFGIEVSEKFSLNELYPHIMNDNSLIAQNHLADLLTNITTGSTETQFECKTENQVNEINLKSGELLINSWSGIEWKEEKTKTVGVTYGGVKMSIGKGTVRQTFGSVNLIKHTQTNFDVIDRGSLYLTSERIIFVGNTVTKTIQNEKVVNIEIFKDGLLIRKENGKSPLICDRMYTISENQTWAHQPIQIPTISNYVGRVIYDDVELIVQ